MSNVDGGLPKEMKEHMVAVNAAKEKGEELPKKTLDDLLPGDMNASIRERLKSGDVATLPSRVDGGSTIYVGASTDQDGNVLALAAGVPRNPGRSEDFLSDVEDFTDSTTDRVDKLDLFHRIYRAEGLVNNSINKSAALIATAGSYKVRYVKGKPGKGSDARTQEFKMLLEWWQENVNARDENGVITGDRGLKAWLSQGARLALIEGDHFARQNWTNVNVPVLQGNSYSLPMNVQTFSARHIEVPEELTSMGLDLMYWVPPQEFIDVLDQGAERPEIQERLDELIPSEIQSELINEGRWLLDPSLMCHAKHRGTGNEPYGESVIECVMADVAYKRALQALDLVTIENLLNRLVILKVGSDNADSVYHHQEVSNERLVMLQNIIRNVGPSGLVLWAGPDLEHEQVGAHNEVLSIDDRYQIARTGIRDGLGTPAALLTGEASDGKAAGWAAVVGKAAELGELQDQYSQIMKTIAERIGLENGFEDVDVVWEFHLDLLANQEVNAQLALQAYREGLYTAETAVEEMGQNYEAELGRQEAAVSDGHKEKVFGPPPSAKGLTPAGDGQDGGRPSEEESEDRDPREDKETQTTDESS